MVIAGHKISFSRTLQVGLNVNLWQNIYRYSNLNYLSHYIFIFVMQLWSFKYTQLSKTIMVSNTKLCKNEDLDLPCSFSTKSNCSLCTFPIIIILIRPKFNPGSCSWSSLLFLLKDTESYDEIIQSTKKCKKWFCNFRSGDFDVKDIDPLKHRRGCKYST